MSRKYLSVKSGDSPSQLEQYLEDPNFGKFDLHLPSKYEWGGRVGQLASIAQLVTTWADRCETPSLKLFTTNADTSYSTDLISRLPGLTAVYFSEHVSEEGSDKNIRFELLKRASPRIHAMWKRDYAKTSRGRTVELISVVGARREFLPALYCKPPLISDLLDRERHGQLVASAEDMAGLFRHFLKTLNPRSRSASFIADLKHNNLIGVLLCEAYRNTAEHAYLTANGTIPQKGLRCVFSSIVSVERNRLGEVSPFSKNIRSSNVVEYLNHVACLERDYPREHVDFLEVSILDSGPGFASTMKQSIPETDETSLVAKCFEIHRSRKPGRNSGQGLYKILSVVKELNGFVRIRTSTCEACFTALDELNEDLGPKPKICGQLAKVVGTLLTVSIPIAY